MFFLLMALPCHYCRHKPKNLHYTRMYHAFCTRRSAYRQKTVDRIHIMQSTVLFHFCLYMPSPSSPVKRRFSVRSICTTLPALMMMTSCPYARWAFKRVKRAMPPLSVGQSLPVCTGLEPLPVDRSATRSLPTRNKKGFPQLWCEQDSRIVKKGA